MHQINQNLRKQQGVVIVVALFIVAIIATLAYVMLARLERDTRRTSLILNDAQAELYAQASLDWAKGELAHHWDNKKPNQLVDHLPMTSPEKIENGFKIVSTIHDMQARFNLNQLTNEGAEEGFKRLLMTVVPGLKEPQAMIIAKATSEWVKQGERDTAFSRYYLTLPNPYREAHRLMISPSELRLVKGMTPAIYSALQPYLTALPVTAGLNVQDAEVPVLMTIASVVTKEVAQGIILKRKQTPFTTLAVFSNLDVVKNLRLETKGLVVTSSYFLVETVVSIEKQKRVLYTLLERVSDGSKARINLLWQSIGTW